MTDQNQAPEPEATPAPESVQEQTPAQAVEPIVPEEAPVPEEITEPAAVPTIEQPSEPAPPPAIPAEPTALPETTVTEPASEPSPVQPVHIDREQSAPASPEPEQNIAIRERVVERVRELTEADKEVIFREKLNTLRPAAVSAKQAGHEQNLSTITVYLKEHSYITNNDVETLCRVADRTATKYLDELERRNLIVQLGQTGRSVRYRLTEAS